MAGARRAAFLKALGKTGNYAVACEQAGVSRGWALKARREEARFDAACREAVAGAKARLVAAGAWARGRSSGHLDGVELVVRGTGGSGGGKRVQIARARAGQWGPRTEETFLQTLRWTCNVKASYEAVGMSKGSAYTHRRRRPEFARCWQDALREGHQRISSSLIASGCNFFSDPDALPEIEIGPMSVGDAIRILRMHERSAAGVPERRVGERR
jgi:hypothetical protein